MLYSQTRLKWLRLLSGRLLPLSLLLLVSMSMVGCTGSKVLSSLLGGGGPKVAANVQAGKTNNQTVGANKTNAPSVSLRPRARVDKIDQSSPEDSIVADRIDTVTKHELPLWVWIVGIVLFVVGWVTDTPATYIRNFKRKK